MARPHADDPRDQTVAVRLTTAERKLLDQRRGGQSITEYVRARILGGR